MTDKCAIFCLSLAIPRENIFNEGPGSRHPPAAPGSSAPKGPVMNPYAAICDDFGIFAYLNTKLELPSSTETVLHFFEAIQKSFPDMRQFERGEAGEFVLEEDTDEGSLRSVTLEPRRLASAHMNPDSLEDADRQHERVLDIAPYHLDLSSLNCDSLDVLFTFDFMYRGNHHAVVAEALAQGSPFEGLLQLPGSRVTHFEPSMMVTLDDDGRLQARLWIETRTSAQQVQSGNFNEMPIRVYFQLHQEWSRQPFKSFSEAYWHRRRLAQELVESHVLPGILLPLQQTIAMR